MKKLVVGITSEKSVVLIEGQLKYFKEKGYKTYLLAPKHTLVDEYCRNEGCEHIAVNMEREISPFKDLIALIKIINHFKKIEPDIVNLGTSKASFLGMIAARISGVKYRIYTSRGFRPMHESGLKRKIMLFTLSITTKFAHKVICISPSVQNIGIEHKMFSFENSFVINKGSSNGIDLNKFSLEKISEEDKSHVKQKLGLNKENFIFGYVGRLVDRKGINELFHAFEQMYLKDNRLRLIFVGSPEYFQIKDKNLIPNMAKHPGIILNGPVPFNQVPLYMSILDAFVLPAWWEGFGNVLIQAAAMGIPVISTKALGTMDAVSDGYNGILIPPKSVKDLINAMDTLNNDPVKCRQYGQSGILWAKNFDSKIIWEGMYDIYENR